jgi:hypothetical protein
VPEERAIGAAVGEDDSWCVGGKVDRLRIVVDQQRDSPLGLHRHAPEELAFSAS